MNIETIVLKKIHHLKHMLLTRPRLGLSMMVMLLTWCVLPKNLPLATQVFSAWNAGVWFYIFSVWLLIFTATPSRIKRIAQQQNDSASFILGLMCLAAVMSLLAIVIELPSIKLLSKALQHIHILLTAMTLISTWIFIPTTFALYYAHAYYCSSRAQPILQFPDNPTEPLYADFLYFSFTIAVASQTADVAVASPELRRAVLLQSILAFVFNTSLIGLTINIVSSLLS